MIPVEAIPEWLGHAVEALIGTALLIVVVTLARLAVHGVLVLARQAAAGPRRARP